MKRQNFFFTLIYVFLYLITLSKDFLFKLNIRHPRQFIFRFKKEMSHFFRKIHMRDLESFLQKRSKRLSRQNFSAPFVFCAVKFCSNYSYRSPVSNLQRWITEREFLNGFPFFRVGIFHCLESSFISWEIFLALKLSFRLLIEGRDGSRKSVSFVTLFVRGGSHVEENSYLKMKNLFW